jgi:hypothetical protein
MQNVRHRNLVTEFLTAFIQRSNRIVFPGLDFNGANIVSAGDVLISNKKVDFHPLTAVLPRRFGVEE